jgi:hypothetical protein
MAVVLVTESVNISGSVPTTPSTISQRKREGKIKMVQDIHYVTISNVLESWELIRRLPKYEEVAGRMLFSRYVQYEFGRRCTYAREAGARTD